MAAALVKLLALCFSIQAVAGDQRAEAGAIVQQARDQVLILTNQLMTNASVVSQAADADASRLLADFHNDISRGIADAQHNATMIGNAFQSSISKRAEEATARATGIYTKVQRALRDATAGVEQAIARLVNSTEQEMARALRPMGSQAPAADSMEKTKSAQ